MEKMVNCMGIEQAMSSDSDTDLEYENIRNKLDELINANCSDDDDYAEDEQPYLADVSMDIPEYIDEKHDLHELGSLHSIVDGVAIVASSKGVPVLDLGTLVVLPDRSSIGFIGDAFGPVESPFYSIKIRDNKISQLAEGLPVMYCPTLSRHLSKADFESSESESENE